MNLTSDRGLVDATIGGDQGAFAILVHRYKTSVVAVAIEVLRDRHAAEDAAQEAFVTAYQELASLRSGGAFYAWLVKIARNAAIQVARRRQREKVLQIAARDGLEERTSEIDDRAEQLLRLVQRLPELEQIVVMLKYLDNHSIHSISEIIGQPVGTVTKRLTRARRRLAVWLKEK